MTAPVLATSSTQGGASSTSVTSRNPSTPTGTAVGDVLVAVAVWRSNADITVSWTGGGTWTRKGSTNHSASLTTARFECPVTSTPAGTITFSATVTGQAIVWVGRITGANTTTPTDVFGSWGTLDATWDAPSVTTTVADTLLLFSAASANVAGAPVTEPSGMTEVVDLVSAGATGLVLEVARENRASAGATGTRTATPATGNGNGALWAIKPAVAGNSAPTVSVSGPTSLEAGASAVATATAADSDGTIASYTWRVVSTTGATPTLTGSGATRTVTAPPALTDSTVVIGVKVTDNAGADSTEATFSVALKASTRRVKVGGVVTPVVRRVEF